MKSQEELSISRKVALARRLARDAGLKMTAVGDGLFRLEGQDHLKSAGQIIQLLDHSDD